MESAAISTPTKPSSLASTALYATAEVVGTFFRVMAIFYKIFSLPSPPPEEGLSKDSLSLSERDRWLTKWNLFQWGLIGASLYGVIPHTGGSFGARCRVMSEIQNLPPPPKTSSLPRLLLSIFPPIFFSGAQSLPGQIFARAVQGVSFYNLIENSSPKLKNSFSALRTKPLDAIKSGAAHLLNFTSATAFLADTAALSCLPLNSACQA